MPATTLHPTGGFFVGQSLDNKIVTWTARDKFRQMKKKEFKGHVNAGYACRMAFSPNGKFLASGDGQGKMYIWDWGSTKVYRKLQVRDERWHGKEWDGGCMCGWYCRYIRSSSLVPGMLFANGTMGKSYP